MLDGENMEYCPFQISRKVFNKGRNLGYSLFENGAVSLYTLIHETLFSNRKTNFGIVVDIMDELGIEDRYTAEDISEGIETGRYELVLVTENGLTLEEEAEFFASALRN